MQFKTLATGSKGNCYIIEAGRSRLMLEAGISIKRILKGGDFDLRGLDACLITHEH